MFILDDLIVVATALGSVIGTALTVAGGIALASHEEAERLRVRTKVVKHVVSPDGELVRILCNGHEALQVDVVETVRVQGLSASSADVMARAMATHRALFSKYVENLHE